MNVSELSNPFVVVAQRATPLTDAARLMREHHVGSLVVVDESGKGRVPVGMLTDRDIVVAAVAAEVDPRTLTAGEVMSGDLATVRASDEVEAALRLMRRRGILARAGGVGRREPDRDRDARRPAREGRRAALGRRARDRERAGSRGAQPQMSGAGWTGDTGGQW